LTEDFLKGIETDEDGFWFNNLVNTGALGNLLRRYHDFALDNVDQEDRGYLLKISPYSNVTQYSLNAFYKGRLISDQFEIPPKFSKPLIAHSISYNSYKFDVTKEKFTEGVRVFVKDIAEEKVIKQDIIFPTNATVGDEIEVEVEDLELDKEYSFSVKYITEVGTSTASPESSSFHTSPLSPPTRVTADEVTTDSITVNWGKPMVYAEGLDETLVTYKVTLKGESGEQSQDVTDFSAKFENLDDATNYLIDVKAVYNGRESAPQTIEVVSSPLPPTISEFAVYEHNAILTWSPPERLGDGVSLIHYVIIYSMEGSDEVKEIVVADNNCELTDLAMGSVYRISAKIVTTAGISNFSTESLLETKYTETEMGKFRDEVYGAIGDVVDNIRRETRFCAFQDSSNDKGIIPYDKTTSEINNVDGGSINVASGLVTIGWDGVYQVAYSMRIESEGAQEHSIWVVVNGAKHSQSLTHSQYDVNDLDSRVDNVGRVIMIKLQNGDTVGLTHETDGTSPLQNINFCVSSVMLQ